MRSRASGREGRGSDEGAGPPAGRPSEGKPTPMWVDRVRTDLTSQEAPDATCIISALKVKYPPANDEVAIQKQLDVFSHEITLHPEICSPDSTRPLLAQLHNQCGPPGAKPDRVTPECPFPVSLPSSLTWSLPPPPAFLPVTTPSSLHSVQKLQLPPLSVQNKVQILGAWH